jgi:amino acid transporter/nucleotide-binding universal stress UspA family protein
VTTETKQITGELARDLSLFHVVMMGLGMMIGAGVFVGIGLSIQSVGPGGLLLVFGLNGLVAVFTAMSFAELSSAIPRAGGAYNFARIAFGRPASFLAGWMEWFASSLAGAFYAIVFASYALDFLNQMLAMGLTDHQVDQWAKPLALAAALVFIYINYRGSSETGKIGALFTVGQMMFVLGIALVGVVIAVFHPERVANFQPFMPRGWFRLMGAMGVIYVAFEGFEVIAQAGDETIDPRKNIPKAMLYSVLVVTVTYVFVAMATVLAVSPESPDLGGLAPWERIAQEGGLGFRYASRRMMPWEIGNIPLGVLLVTLAVIFSATSALNATIYSATRASYALGRDRMLPGQFSRLSRKHRTPVVALLGTSVIVLIAAGLLNHEDGAATASIMFLFLFFLVNLCVIKIRRNMGDELQYGYLMPLFPLFPVLGIICQAALAGGIVEESLVAWIVGPAWVLAGVGVYLLYSRHHAISTEEEIHVLEESAIGPAAEGKTRIMVSVANPETAVSMVQTTYKLCQSSPDPQVELLHMVPVPDQVPLSDAHKYMLEGKEGILETMIYLGPLFPVTAHLRYCRNISRGIISAVREKKTDMLIMGWHGRAKGGLFKLGSTLDPVIERSPCDVVVLKDTGGNRDFKRVLVPLAGGPNSLLALKIAAILADDEEGQVTCFNVAGGRKHFDVEAFLSQNASDLNIAPERLEIKVVPAQPVVEAILREAQEADLVVLGSTQQPILRQVGRTPVPETVAQRCPKPLVMVKSGQGLRSWLGRWI